MKKNVIGVLIIMLIIAGGCFYGGYSYYPYKHVSSEKLYIFINPDKKTVAPGSTFTYNFLVFNAGDTDLTGITGSDSAGGLNWDIGTLKSGQCAFISRTYSVDENPTKESIQNTLTVKCDQVGKKSVTDKTPIVK